MFHVGRGGSCGGFYPPGPGHAPQVPETKGEAQAGHREALGLGETQAPQPTCGAMQD